MTTLFSKKDTMVLDTRIESEYDTERTLKPEYDNLESSSCHSGLRVGIQRDNKLMPKAFRFAQSGRSMVEMLGVLAIVGVLSIGGIAGYSYGMDKYRANETINQIMLRAIDLMTQASNNNAELSLAGWSNETSQYDFANEDYTEDGLIAFDMGINNPLPKSVCEMVYDGMSSMAEQIDINGARAESNNACAEENEMTFYFEGQIGTRCIPECAENEYCYNGICFKGGVPEGSPYVPDTECTSHDDCNADWISGYECSYCYNNQCIVNVLANGEACTIKEGGIAGQCYSGICYPKGCTTNSDCTEIGTYCATPNESSTERFQDGERGSCVPLDFIKKEIAGKTYYISNGYLNWWDAEYACDAIGAKKMVDVADLVEESTWNGERDSDVVFTALGQELKRYLGDNLPIWTKDSVADSSAPQVRTNGSIDICRRYNNFSTGNALVVCH